MNYEVVYAKLQEYLDLMDFDNDYFKSDFKNNYKFIKSGVTKFIKAKLSEDEIVLFIQTAIDIHCEIYVMDNILL